MIKPTYQNAITPRPIERRPAQQPSRQTPGHSQAARAPKGQATTVASLSSDERRMIGDQFPESRRMALRLYGPARPADQASSGLGRHIDLKG